MFSSSPPRKIAEPSPSEALAASSPELTLHGVDDPRRGAVEDFIGEIYARRYGAEVQQFAPMLVCLREGGELLAAAGYRSATQDVFYLERYLPKPVRRSCFISRCATFSEMLTCCLVNEA